MGRNYCSLCANASGSDSQVHFFPIPYQNADLLKKWENKCRKKFQKGVNQHLCSAHFSENAYDPEYLDAKKKLGDSCKKKAKLKRDALPESNTNKRKFDEEKTAECTNSSSSDASSSDAKAAPDSSTDISDCHHLLPDGSKKTKLLPAILQHTRSDGKMKESSSCPRPVNNFQHSTPKKQKVGAVRLNSPTFMPTSPIHAVVGEGLSTVQFNNNEVEPEDIWSDASDGPIDLDKTYEPSTLNSSSANFSAEFQDEDINDSLFRDEDTNSHKYLIAEISQVELLLKKCRDCGGPTEINKSRMGAAFTFHCSCAQGHKFVWSTSSKKERKPLINILLVAAIFCSGLGFTAFQRFSDTFGLAIMGHSTFYSHLAAYVSPVLLNDWVKMRRDILKEMIAAGWKAVLSGDARFDSPGHCAKYAIYTIMCNITGRVVDFVVWQQGLEPGEMESKAFDFVFRRVVDALSLSKIWILCTDRNLSVAKKMREKFKDIVHEYDIWHLSKSVGKVLKKLSNKFKEIADWIPAIRNHMWYAAESCKGDENLLVQKWASLTHHIQGKHKWKIGRKKYTCDHLPLSEDQQEARDWIEKGPALAALTKATQNTRLINQLKHCKNFVHTGNLESFHNLCLIYMPKRIAYSYEGMVLRTILAAMDNNYNVGRKVTGTQIQYSKASKQHVLLDRYAKKSDIWRRQLVERIVEFVHNPGILTEDPAEVMELMLPFALPDNIAQTEKPSKEVLAEKRRSRLQKSKV